MCVHIEKVDDGFGLFWEDGVPVYDIDSDRGGLYPIKVWKRRGWAIRYAAMHGMELSAAPPRNGPHP